MKRELSSDRGFDDRAWVIASNYLAQNNLDLNLALTWADRALDVRTNGQLNFEGLSNKALSLDKLGRTTEADAAMDQALPLGNVFQIHQYGRRLIGAKKGERALQVFQLNVKKHPDVWPVNYGLARGYSAVGNYPAALEALLKAQKKVPEGDTVNPPVIETNIEKLKRGEDIN
jgi:tetratricopeptide (TPR) repeat protein